MFWKIFKITWAHFEKWGRKPQICGTFFQKFWAHFENWGH
jgi:hypothetical protein